MNLAQYELCFIGESFPADPLSEIHGLIKTLSASLGNPDQSTGFFKGNFVNIEGFK